MALPNNRLPLRGINPLPLRNVQPKKTNRTAQDDDRKPRSNAVQGRQNQQSQGRNVGYGSAMSRYAERSRGQGSAETGGGRQFPTRSMPASQKPSNEPVEQIGYAGQYAAGASTPSATTEQIEDNKTPLTGQKEDEQKPASWGDWSAWSSNPEERQKKVEEQQQKGSGSFSQEEAQKAMEEYENEQLDQADKNWMKNYRDDSPTAEDVWKIPVTEEERERYPSQRTPWNQESSSILDQDGLPRTDDPVYASAEDIWKIPVTEEEAERYRSQPFDSFNVRDDDGNSEKNDEDSEESEDTEYSADADSTEAYFMSVKDELGFERDYSDIVDMQLNGTEGDWSIFVNDPTMAGVYGPEIMGDQWDGQTITDEAFSAWFWDNRNNNDFYGAIDNLDAETLYRMYGTDYDLMNQVMQQYDPGYADYYGYSEASPENVDAFYDNLIANAMASMIGGEQGLTTDDLFTLDQLNDMTRLDNWTYGEGDGFDMDVNPEFDTWDEVYSTFNGIPEGDITADYPYWMADESGAQVAVPRSLYEQQNQAWGPDGLALPFFGDPNYITAMTGYGRREK